VRKLGKVSVPYLREYARAGGGGGICILRSVNKNALGHSHTSHKGGWGRADICTLFYAFLRGISGAISESDIDLFNA